MDALLDPLSVSSTALKASGGFSPEREWDILKHRWRMGSIVRWRSLSIHYDLYP